MSVSRALADEVRRLGARRIEVIPNGVEVRARAGRRGRPAAPAVRRAASRPRRASRSSPRPRGASRWSSAATGPCAASFRMRSASCRIQSSSAAMRLPLSSSAPRGERDSALPAPRRWPTASRSWPRASAVCSTSSSMARPACSSRPAMRPSCGPPSSGCWLSLTCDGGSGQPRRAHVAELCSWERVTEATIDVYREAAGGARRRR